MITHNLGEILGHSYKMRIIIPSRAQSKCPLEVLSSTEVHECVNLITAQLLCNAIPMLFSTHSLFLSFASICLLIQLLEKTLG